MKSVIWAFALMCLLACVSTALAAEEPALVKPKVNYKALNKLGWKLCSQAYTFRDRSFFETVDTLNALGIRYVELFPGQQFSKEKPDAKVDHGMSDELIAELKAKCKAAKVTPVCYGVVGIGSGGDDSRKVFEFCKKLGIRNIAIEPAEADIPALDKLAREYKINLAIHNHPKESHYWNPDTVLKVAQGRSKRIGACADTGHWARSGLVPVECIRKLEGRIAYFHFKDLNELNKMDAHDVPWGTGKCDVKAMLAEIKRQKLKPVISAEYEHGSGKELDANMARCVQALSDLATAMAAE